MARPQVSVIIVNWNGRKWLRPCLESLRQQTFSSFEVILVDNASTDGSVKFVRRHFPEVKVVQNTENQGFAGGNNAGLSVAEGRYIILLNNDTVADSNYLNNFVRAFKKNPRLGAAQSKLVRMNDPGKLDSCGSFWTTTTFLYHVGHSKDCTLPMYNKPFPVFSCKGASMIIRRDVIEKLDLFDDDFWCYYEETDFCHRLWIAGYECWYLPQAVVLHAEGGTSLRFDNSYIQFHNFKNKLLSYLKNFEARSLIKIVPTYLLTNGSLSILWCLQGKWGSAAAFYKALWWNIRYLPRTLRKRRRIQHVRKISDRAIQKHLTHNPRWQYYYAEITGKGLDMYEDPEFNFEEEAA